MRLPDKAPYRFIRQVDVRTLQQRMTAISAADWWRLSTDLNRHGALNTYVDSIVLRHGAGPGADFKQFIDLPAAWGLLGDAVQPIIDQLPGAHRIRLARLRALGCIARHCDQFPSNKVRHRLHVVVATNPGVIFDLNGTLLHMPEGSVYEIDNIAPHSVRNDGSSDRIHLCVDYID